MECLAGLGSPVFAAWAGPRLWTIARDRGFLTLGDWLEWRYGGAVRGVSSIIIWFISLSILAGQLLGASSILEVVAGLPRWAGALAAVVVVVIYFVAGGLLTSAWVNLVQLVVNRVGFLSAVRSRWRWSADGQRCQGAGLPVGYLLRGAGGSSLICRWREARVVHEKPGATGFNFGKRKASLRIGAGANAVGLIAFAIVPVTLGMVARVLHPALASPDQALPTLLAVDLPPLVGALTLAAVFSAEVSAADAVLFMLSTSMAQDLYRRFLAPEADDARILRVARGSAIAAGVAGLAMALLLFLALGSAATPRRTLPEFQITAGWGLACLVLTVWGVFTPWSLRWAAAALGLAAAAWLARSGWRECVGAWAALSFVTVSMLRRPRDRREPPDATFGDRLAVEDVTFEVGKGEVFGLLGPNGAGKTTTLRMLAGLIADGGRGVGSGVPLTKQSIDRVRGQVGFSPRRRPLGGLSVRMNLLTYARLHQLRSARVAERALARFGPERADSLARATEGSGSALPSPARAPRSARRCWTSPHRGWTRKARGWCAISCRAAHARPLGDSVHATWTRPNGCGSRGVLRGRFLAIASPTDLRRRIFGAGARPATEMRAASSDSHGAGAKDVSADGRT